MPIFSAPLRANVEKQCHCFSTFALNGAEKSYPLKRCWTRTILARRSGASGLEPKSFPWRRSELVAIRFMVLVADQPCAKRWAPKALMMEVANEEPHQSAQPDVFWSPPGNLGVMKTPRTASG